jgi:hypothetical protein
MTPDYAESAEILVQGEAALDRNKVVLKAEELAFGQSFRPFNSRYFDVPRRAIPGTAFSLSVLNQNYLNTITEYEKEKIAECYVEVFNESWLEAWTIKDAITEIDKSFNPNRDNIATLLWKGSDIIGFCWATTTEVSELNPDVDMPYTLNEDLKKHGISVAKYWVSDVAKKTKVLFLREIGLIKQFRNNLAPWICLPIFEYGLNHNVDVSLYWTNIHSGAFKWGLGVGWTPIHFFLNDDLVLMQGNLFSAVSTAQLLTKSKDRTAYRNLNSKINHYLCKR